MIPRGACVARTEQQQVLLLVLQCCNFSLAGDTTPAPSPSLVGLDKKLCASSQVCDVVDRRCRHDGCLLASTKTVERRGRGARFPTDCLCLGNEALQHHTD